MMNIIFKLKVFKSVLKLYFQRIAFERNPSLSLDVKLPRNQYNVAGMIGKI